MSGLDATFLLSRLPAILPGLLAADRVEVRGARKLSGGAIQENWALDLDIAGGARAGQTSMVLRTDAPRTVASSRSRADEFRIVRAAWRAGVKVPEPIALDEDGGALGRPFFLCAFLRGVALGPKIVKDAALGGPRGALVRELGAQLARIHAIVPDEEVGAVLGPRPASVTCGLVAGYRADLDAVSRPAPIVELALRWLERHAPQGGRVAFCHRDYRTGNFLVDAEGLVAILDWEFAGWSDPLEDFGWFCSKRWRFGADERPAGGIGGRDDLFAGYADAGGARIDPDAATYWELMANARWAVIAHQQADRLLVGGERALELALIGRRIHETEHEILRLLRPRLGFAA